MYFWEAQRANGALVHMVPTDDGITVPIERLLDAIDEQTLLVPVSHVIFRSAYIQDAMAIIEKAHRVGAHVVLDTFSRWAPFRLMYRHWMLTLLVAAS